MSKKNPAEAKPRKKGSGLLGRIIRRFFLVLFTVIFLAVAVLLLVMNLIFNGPSPAARSVLTMSLIEASATKWVPALFIGQEAVDQIKADINAPLAVDQTDTSQVVISRDSTIGADEWADHPDGIRIENVKGSTFDAYVMIIRDPAQVYMGVSSEKFSTSIPGKRLNRAVEEEGAIAGINAGAFYDDGSLDPIVGSHPLGLVVAGSTVRWTSGQQPDIVGFAGFNKDDVLVVTARNPSKAEAEEMNIRDGCCFGPALIINGEINLAAYNEDAGWNPRTAIGQRADGAVLFVCADGRQPSSPGATYADITDIMVEYGAVNACNMDGGSSTIMMYRDTYGKMWEPGTLQAVNSYSLIQSEPRRMPNYWLVRPVA